MFGFVLSCRQELHRSHDVNSRTKHLISVTVYPQSARFSVSGVNMFMAHLAYRRMSKLWVNRSEDEVWFGMLTPV